MELVEELKLKSNLTREDIANLLKSIGVPGENKEAKLEAIKQLDKSNFQGIKLETTIEEYQEY